MLHVFKTTLNVLNPHARRSRRAQVRAHNGLPRRCALLAGRCMKHLLPPAVGSVVLIDSQEMLEFGPFRLDPAHRTLWRDGESVPLSSRAFDILLLLAENRGRVVGKDEILSTVWRGMIVEENNLAVQISALRRALAGGLETPVILTVPGQGYRFVADIGRRALPPEPAAAPQAKPVPAEPAPPAATFPAEVAPSSAKLSRRWLWLGAGAVGLVAGAWLLARHGSPPEKPPLAPPPRFSIAVLPFRDLSDDRCCDYLADAISDDLTTDLSHIPGSVVIARESSDVFRGRALPTAEIGQALNVRYLLEGSLRAVEGQFSINAQLIEASSGTHLWAERFTVPRAKLGEAQDSIVRRLGSALGVTLVDIEGARAEKVLATSPDALDLYLRARSLMDRDDSLAGLTRAQALLEQARAKRPDDPAMLGDLAWLLVLKANNFVVPDADAEIAEAQRAAAHALELRPDDPNALAAQGAALTYNNKCAEAERLYDAALGADPANLRALAGSMLCFGKQAEFQPMADRLTMLLRIDPEGSRKRVRMQQLGFAYLMLGRAQEALPWLERATAGMPPPTRDEDAMGPAEWGALSLIAATRIAGDTARSDDLARAYNEAYPHRSVWFLQAYASKKLAASPGFIAFLAALRDAGLPEFTADNADWHVPAPQPGAAHPMVAPTPLAIPGVKTVEVADIGNAMRSGAALLDFGRGAAVPAGARLVSEDPGSESEMMSLVKDLRSASVHSAIVMGTGPLDMRGYDAAAWLAAGRGLTVFWYRGGEEGWQAAGQPAQDLR